MLCTRAVLRAVLDPDLQGSSSFYRTQRSAKETDPDPTCTVFLLDLFNKLLQIPNKTSDYTIIRR
jgi:hypothetical protein